jgi:hypothetical protein
VTWQIGRAVSKLDPGVLGVSPGTTQVRSEYTLEQGYPNPFNPSCTIEFSLPKSIHVSLVVFNALGQVVTTLIDEELPAGSHKVWWDGTGHASGAYYYRLNCGSLTETKKVILLK